MICTFFGHKDSPKQIRPKIRETLKYLIENKKADTFYVGSQGNFDKMVLSELLLLKNRFENINIYVVLAYIDDKENDFQTDTVFLSVLENVPLKYAIDRRNGWMVDKADIVITYVIYPFGGANKFKEMAKKKRKTVIEISEI